MSIFKSTNFIFDFPWAENEEYPTMSAIHLPPQVSWDKQSQPSIRDINLWEQIYLEPGNVGVYAAWNPYTELYLITYNLLLGNKQGYETFYGENAVESVISRCKEFNVVLAEYRAQQQ